MQSEPHGADAVARVLRIGSSQFSGLARAHATTTVVSYCCVGMTSGRTLPGLAPDLVAKFPPTAGWLPNAASRQGALLIVLIIMADSVIVSNNITATGTVRTHSKLRLVTEQT